MAFKVVSTCSCFSSYIFCCSLLIESPSRGKSQLRMKMSWISNSIPMSCFPGRVSGPWVGCAVHLSGDGKQSPEEQDASGGEEQSA